ncbi:MAG: hypothetical protein OEV08_06050 [Nitrospira sp.]|nr:hypothetical protein [Nitrospira sp.]
MASCSDPNAARRQLLLSDLRRIDNDYALLSQTISNRKNKSAYLEQWLLARESELSDYKRRVTAYMMDHKMAIAALALGVSGTAVALDSTNKFSSDAKAMAGIAAAVAAIWALDNAREVAAVADQLTQADSHVRSIESQIAETSSTLTSEAQKLLQEERSLFELQGNREKIRTQLEALH